MNADERVAAGVALLDEKGPEGWRERINLDTLDINSLAGCILGQIYGPECLEDWMGWRTGMDALGLERYGSNEARDHGFEAYNFSEQAEVEAAWADILTPASV